MEEILDLDVLQAASPLVLAGSEHLDRPVRWVHISEQPDIADYLKGGELLLTTLMGLGRDIRARRDYVRRLAAARLAGLLVRLGGEFSTVPQEITEEAAQAGLPLVLLRHRIGFVEVTERVHGTIVSRQFELLRRADQVRSEFTDLVLRGASLARIISRLTDLVQNAVILEDAAHQVIEFAGYGGRSSDLLMRWEQHSRLPHTATFDAGVQVETADVGCVWVPIWLRSEPWGRVHVLQRERVLDEVDLMAIDRATTALSLALLTERDARSAADRARSALIGDMLSGRLVNAEEFARRARSLGMTLVSSVVGALAVELGGLAEFLATHELEDLDRQAMRAEILEQIRAAIRSRGLSSLSGLDGDRVLAVVSLPPDFGGLLTDIAVDVRDRISRSRGRLVVPIVGISEAATLDLVRRALLQAGEAAEFGARVSTAPGTYNYRDLGIYHLLLPLADGPRLAEYVEAELGVLMEHDARRGAPMVRTLRSFLDHGGQVSAAARDLFIERRTLYHRVKAISKLLGRDLDNPDNRLRLSVALRALDLVHGQRGSSPPPDLPQTMRQRQGPAAARPR